MPTAAAAAVVIADAIRLQPVGMPGVPEIIVDDSSSSSARLGAWSLGQFIGGYDGTYWFAVQSDTDVSTAYWAANITTPGDYEVATYYTPSSNRASGALYRIEHASGMALVSIDQTKGGNWQSLGTYHFGPGTYFIELSNRIAAAPAQSMTCDNGEPLFDCTAGWTTGTVSAGYLDDYIYAGCSPADGRSASWTLPLLAPGLYRLLAWFSPGSNRTTGAHYTIANNSVTTPTTLDQTTGAPGWHPLMVVPLQGTCRVALDNTGATDKVVIADAVRAEYLGDMASPFIEVITDELTTPSAGHPFHVGARVWSETPLSSVKLARVGSGGTTDTADMFDDGQHEDGAAADNLFGGEAPGGNASEILTYWVTATNAVTSASSPSSRCLVAYDHTTTPELRWVFAGGINSTYIGSLVDRVRGANLNTIVFSVRSVADAGYISSYEPLTQGVPAGFDPLGYVIARAHDTTDGKPRIQVHPLVLVYRVLVGGNPPPGHVLALHPEWASENYAGEKVVSERMYLDPGVPEVQDYNLDVFTEIIRNYDIDGFNLDTIRYLQGDHGYNATALFYFRAFTGRTDRPAVDDPQWSDWRRLQVTSLVRRVHAAMLRYRPNALLSVDAICFDNAHEQIEDNQFYHYVYQDWPQWLRTGAIDVAMGMAYKREDDPVQSQWFLDWQSFMAGQSSGRASAALVGSYDNYADGTFIQVHKLRQASADYIGLFSDEGNNRGTVPRDLFYAALKSQVFPDPADPPTPSWKRLGRGHLAGRVYDSGVPARLWEIELGTTTPQTIRTDLCGFYSFFDVVPGSYTLTIRNRADSVVWAHPITISADVLTGKDVRLGMSSAADEWLSAP